VLEYAPILHD